MVESFCVTCAVIGYPYLVFVFHAKSGSKKDISQFQSYLNPFSRNSIEYKTNFDYRFSVSRKNRLKFLVFGVIGCE